MIRRPRFYISILGILLIISLIFCGESAATEDLLRSNGSHHILIPNIHAIKPHILNEKISSPLEAIISLSPSSLNQPLVLVDSTDTLSPVITSVDPAQVEQGDSIRNMVIRGKNFRAGSYVNITKDNNSRPVIGISVKVNYFAINAASIDLTLARTVKPGLYDIMVIPPNGTPGIGKNLLKITEYSYMKIRSISPNSGVQGESYPVIITGLNFSTRMNVPKIWIGTEDPFAGGADLSDVVVKNDTCITGILKISAYALSAPPGRYYLKIWYNSSTWTLKPDMFTIKPSSKAPVISSFYPDSIILNKTAVTYTKGVITGSNLTTYLNFIRVNPNGRYPIHPPGSGWAAYDEITSSRIAGTFIFTPNSHVGSYLIEVTDNGYSTIAHAMNVTGAMGTAPVISSISPSSCYRMETIGVKIRGRNFLPNPEFIYVKKGELQYFLSGTYINENELLGSLYFPIDAPVGMYNLTIINNDGQSGSSSYLFTVNDHPAPTVKSITPSSARRSEYFQIKVSGENFYNCKRVSLERGYQSIDNETPVITDSSHKWVTTYLNLSTNPLLGKWDVTVENYNGKTGTGDYLFTVLNFPAPVIQFFRPTSANQKDQINLEIYGNNFFSPTYVYLRKGTRQINGIIKDVKNRNIITAKFYIPATAEKGKYDVYITIEDGQIARGKDLFTVK